MFSVDDSCAVIIDNNHHNHCRCITSKIPLGINFREAMMGRIGIQSD